MVPTVGRTQGSSQATVVALHEASFAQQPGDGSQQGYCVFVGREEVLTARREVGAHLVNWAPTKIRGVVRSTRAAGRVLRA